MNERPLRWIDWRWENEIRGWRWILAVEWLLEWVDYRLKTIALFGVLSTLGNLALLVAITTWLMEADDRVHERTNKAWNTLDSTSDKAHQRGPTIVRALESLVDDGVDLSGVYLNKPNLFRARLSRACLARAILYDAYMEETRLEGADLTGAKLAGARLQKSRLARADLQDADLKGATFGNTNLDGANLTDADLSGAKFAVCGRENAPGSCESIKTFGGMVTDIPIQLENARLCRTTMPDGKKVERDCDKDVTSVPPCKGVGRPPTTLDRLVRHVPWDTDDLWSITSRLTQASAGN
jgi:hypothetical protein